MRIAVKRVRRIEKYIPQILRNAPLRVAVMEGHISEEKRENLNSFSENQKFLPPIVGPNSKFNAEGRWKTIKNLPKVKTYLGTFVVRRSEFNGPNERIEVERSVDFYRMCYEKDLIAPPAEEFGLTISNGNLFVVSNNIDQNDFEKLKHIVNVFLEVYGCCEIVGANDLPSPLNLQRKNWKFLPPGNSVASKIEKYLTSSNFPENVRPIIEDRQRFLVELGAENAAVGLGGFKDYIAFIFKDSELVVLESMQKDNALYVFSKNWESFSQLTKTEILAQDLHLARIVHTTGWKEKLKSTLQL